MAFRITTGTVEINAKTKGVGTALKDLQSRLGKIANIAKRVAGPLALAFGTRASIAAAEAQIGAQARLEAVIQATGRAAGLSSHALIEYAKELQAAGDVSDEAVIGAQAILATFTKIKGDIFKDTVKVATDLSVLLGTDMKSAALQLGKALNDPIRGISALAEVGVSFSESQREQIKQLEEAGKTAEAQRLILTALKEQGIDGLNEAIARTPVGKYRAMNRAISDLSAGAGAGLLEGLSESFESLTNFVRSIVEPVKGATKFIVDAFNGISDGVTATLGGAFEAVTSIFKITGEAIGDVVDTLSEGERLAGDTAGFFTNMENSAEGVAKSLDKWKLKLDEIGITMKVLFPAMQASAIESIENIVRAFPQLFNVLGEVFLTLPAKIRVGVNEIAATLFELSAQIATLFGDVDLATKFSRQARLLVKAAQDARKEVARLEESIRGSGGESFADLFLKNLGETRKNTQAQIRKILDDAANQVRAKSEETIKIKVKATIEDPEETFKRVQAQILAQAPALAGPKAAGATAEGRAEKQREEQRRAGEKAAAKAEEQRKSLIDQMRKVNERIAPEDRPGVFGP